MKRSRLASLSSFVVMALAVLIGSPSRAEPSGRTVAEINFKRDILPIFEKKCLACHSGQSSESGLVLETLESVFEGGTVSGPAVIAGDSSQSPLVLYLNGEKEPRMPLDAPLPEEEIALIARWIEQLKPVGQEEAETQLAGGVDSDHGFEEEIRPILEKSCFSCHSSETHRSGLVLETVESLLKGGGAGGPAIVLGKSGESPLILHLRGDKAPRMPLEGIPLAEEEITRIASWIDGLDASVLTQAKPDFGWPWIKLERPSVPEVGHQKWVTNPIDAFVLAKLEVKSLEPAPVASKRVLLRRISFDLTGLPPSPEEMERFLQDSSPDAYQRQIDRLLASSHYGERWGRHWLDLVRYGDSEGAGEDATRPHMWRYRDYVIRAFNQDRPYDRFIREQLAGDNYSVYGTEGKLALGYFALVVRGEDTKRRDLLIDAVDTTGSVFLGMTLGCARCHDHKFDPILQRDYYRMEAFFPLMTIGPTDLPFTPYEVAGLNPDEWKKKAKLWEKVMARRGVLRDRSKAEFKQRVKDHRMLVTSQDPKDRVIAVFDQGLSRKFKEAILFNKAEQDLQRLIGRQNNPYGTPSHADIYKPVAYSVSEVARYSNPAVPTTYLLGSGDPDSKVEEVQPGFLSAAVGHSDPVSLNPFRPASGRRKLLADWIASPDNPLTARVMVNRIWKHHFGNGLVRTPSDFGKNGSGTSHSELIDWMASDFIDNGWSIKEMHRLILQSNVYRQSIRNPRHQEYEKIDPQNRYYWRGNPLRLEAEVIRDSILAVSGELNPAPGGPGFLPDLDLEFLESRGTWWEPSPRRERSRRTVYMYQLRSFPLPLVQVFDGPNMGETCATRSVTNNTPQVFALFNNKFVHEQSQRMVNRIVRKVGKDLVQQVEWAFQLALQRSPTSFEKIKSLGFLGQSTTAAVLPLSFAAKPGPSRDLESMDSADLGSGLQGKGSLFDLCLVLLNTNEFIFLE